ncbi:MAG: hypothetical protein ACI8UO_003195 [Verrucomicrobiales bacterium]|jgi:hypothetical protein
MNFLTGVLIIAAIIGFVTNPDKEAHLEGIKQHVQQETGYPEAAHDFVGNVFDGVMAVAVDGLKWENYYVCSKLVGPEGETISWGAFGKIVFPEE